MPELTAAQREAIIRRRGNISDGDHTLDPFVKKLYVGCKKTIKTFLCCDLTSRY